MREILQPGIYENFPEADYYRDPCPAPSLTQSVAKILLDRSPLHAWHAHPKLNPDYRHDDDTGFDLGNVAHKLLLGRGKDIVRLEFDDWRTKAAKEARDVAASAGKLAVLGKHYARAERMVEAAREQLDIHGLNNLFKAGATEVVLAWKEDQIWCRQLVDCLSTDRTIFADYKTTDYSVAHHTVGRLMATAGWDVQAAFAERGLNSLDGQCKRRFLFIAQETQSPHCLSVVELTADVMTMGHKKVSHALEVWGRCMTMNLWPGYPHTIVRPEYPGWAESQWLEREIADAARERWAQDELSRRKDEGEPLSGYARAIHNILQAG